MESAISNGCQSDYGPDPTAIFAAQVVEGPNNFLPLSADFKFRIYFVKLTSKFGKIGLLDDPEGQGSSPKDFICRLDLSNGLNPDLVASGLHSGPLKILLFSKISPYVFI
jgi:hypothetical protein